MVVMGKIDVAVKFSEMPKGVKDFITYKEFSLDAEGKEILIKLPSKMYKRLAQDNQKYPSWVALIEGKMGEATEKGFILDEPSIQIFEKKPKVVSD